MEAGLSPTLKSLSANGVPGHGSRCTKAAEAPRLGAIQVLT